MSCALLFFGVVKQFDIVLPTIRQHVLNVNPNCTVFVHTYNIRTVTNPRNKEVDAPISPQDAFKLSSNVMFENTSNVNVVKYRPYFPHNRRWSYPVSMDSMILQWNSIARVASWAFGVRKFTRVGFFRMDVVYLTNIDISQNKATIPGFLPSGGYNDRLFYGLSQYAQVWATRFPKVEKYLKTNKGIHSEHFVKYILQQEKVPLTIDNTICFHRIRATNIVQNDCKIGRDDARLGKECHNTSSCAINTRHYRRHNGQTRTRERVTPVLRFRKASLKTAGNENFAVVRRRRKSPQMNVSSLSSNERTT